MNTLYETQDVEFRAVARHEDVDIVITPEGYRLRCPPPFPRYTKAYQTPREALQAAQRFCEMRRRG
ncbi:MAG: hypothetical protein AAGI01_04685 [Myxococcota bacterium]